MGKKVRGRTLMNDRYPMKVADTPNHLCKKPPVQGCGRRLPDVCLFGRRSEAKPYEGSNPSGPKAPAVGIRIVCRQKTRQEATTASPGTLHGSMDEASHSIFKN